MTWDKDQDFSFWGFRVRREADGSTLVRGGWGFLILITAALVLLLVLASSALAVSPERRVARWVNLDRARHDRAMLDRSWPLDNMAEHHSRRMGGQNRIRPMDADGYVLAAARPGHLFTDTIVAWRHSRHRLIVRGAWDRMGVGVVRAYGRLWVTVVFRG